MQILVLFILLFLVLAGAFTFLIVHPAWMLIDCSKSALSGKQKTVWILVMLAGWPFGGLAYGVSRKENQLIRSVSLAGIVLSVIMAVVTIYAVICVAKQTRGQMAEVQAKISQVDWSSATQMQKAEMEKALSDFSAEVNSKKLYLNLRVNSDLAALGAVYLADNKLSAEEVTDWVGNFNHRKDMDPDRFHAHLKKARGEPD